MKRNYDEKGICSKEGEMEFENVHVVRMVVD